ncbi:MULTISPECIES: GAF domain-containing protein [unclassified Nocardioides]|uniref:GAF domain-containing protein n=1 Tax=unclassified Nocardioides TaxID=2615069 RepID=UPI00301445F9
MTDLPDLESPVDRYSRMVRHTDGVPVALVTVPDPTCQVVLGAADRLPEPSCTTGSGPLTHSFCQRVVEDGRTLTVDDAREVPELRSHGAIRDMDVIAYPGWPLVDGFGAVVGSSYAPDTEPREWTSAEILMMRDLAACCSAELDVRVPKVDF